MAKNINFKGIKEEFIKAKNTIKKLFYTIGAVFILFIILIVFLFFSSKNSAKDSIVSCLPDNTIFYAHIASLSNDKITNFFTDQMEKYLKIEKDSAYNKIFPYLGQEAAIVVLQNNNEILPFFIFKIPAAPGSPNGNSDRTLAETSTSNGIDISPIEKNATVENLTEKKLIILSENNNAFKEFQDSSNFKKIPQIKKFAKKYSPDLTFYIDINKIYSEENNLSILDNAILAEMKNKNEILAGIKKINDSYEIAVADIEQNIFSKINFQDELDKKYDENIIFSAKTTISNNISLLPKEFLENFLDLKEEEIEIILTSNPKKNLQKNNSTEYLRNQLMLNGENSPLQYIIILKNNTKNQNNLEKIKTFFINYLDEKLPEEKIVSLPDGSLMTELWSNPKRFTFETTGDSPIYYLKNTQLNFEFSYSGNNDIILLSNSENTLKDYLSKKLEPKTDGEDTFFINTDNLKNDSIIINALNYFGNYADGRLKIKK